MSQANTILQSNCFQYDIGKSNDKTVEKEASNGQFACKMGIGC